MLYKLTMENGAEQIIKTDMGMFDLSNELRGKSKIAVADTEGKSLSIKSADVHSIEHFRVQRIN